MTKLFMNGTTTLKNKRIKNPKFSQKIWFEQSMLLASLPVLVDEMTMLKNIYNKEELKQLENLLINYEYLLNKKL